MSKRLAELNRQTQILLEQHRLDPDNEPMWVELVATRRLRDAEWLRHTTR
jgi:hypothetical protein